MKKKFIIIIGFILLSFLLYYYKNRLFKNKRILEKQILNLRKKSNEYKLKAEHKENERLNTLRRIETERELTIIRDKLKRVKERESILSETFNKNKKELKNMDSLKEVFESMRDNW
jgi:hypothetical protein